MKKLSVLFLSAVLVLSLCACGKEEPQTNDATEETVVEETAETTEDTEVTEDAVAEEAVGETATADTIPEIKGTSGEMDYELVGLDITQSYDGGSAIRLWFKVTNSSNSLRYPNYIVGWDGIVCTQNGETLTGTSLLEEQLEDTIAGCDTLPGTTVVYTEKYGMINDSDIVNITIKDSANEYNFDVDPATFTSVIPEPYTWESVSSSDWFQPVSDEIEIMGGIKIKVLGCELIKGNPWVGSEELDCVRVTYEATNNSDTDTNLGGYFDILQDGVELQLGTPTSEYAADTDTSITAPIAQGETIQYALTYVLYNTESPVMVVYDDFSARYGITFDVK